MGLSEEWRDVLYQKTFEEELRGLERRKTAEKDCTIENLEGTLRNLYIMEGAGWGGRGDVQDTNLAAAIAAYEYFIARWKAEKR
ncbi:MAG: hypothetical protein LBP27_01545 [Treponema sp.]|jgi:hypothetical protein|nr:hypothetical protein [Treponema sp.]